MSFSTHSIPSVSRDGITITDYGRVKHVLLDRPKALNALDLPMIRKLTPLYQSWETQPNCVVIMRGSGDKAFCAGGDIRAIYDSSKVGGNLPRDFFREEYILNYIISKKSVTQVSLLNGITMGGGVGLSVHGKYRVATENTVFAMPETGIGFFCDVGGTYILSRLGALGMYLALTGARLKGKELLLAGIATHYIESSQLDQLEQALIKSENVDRTLAELTDFNTPQLPSSELISFQNEIHQIFSFHDPSSSVESVFSKLKDLAEKKSNENNSSWAQKTLNSLKKMSPTSLKVVHRQLKQGTDLSYPSVFQMEYRISQGFMRSKSDFFEGVRALLVDKDKNPKWNPSSLDAVTDEYVDSFFSPVENDLILSSSRL